MRESISGSTSGSRTLKFRRIHNHIHSVLQGHPENRMHHAQVCTEATQLPDTCLHWHSSQANETPALNTSDVSARSYSFV
jgi:hypothetical protein